MSQNIGLSTGIKVTKQSPLDPKSYFKTLQDLKDLGIDNNNVFTYYDSMLVLCAETKKQYMWREKVGTEQGVRITNFTYPVGSISNGVDYSNKVYNFFEFKNTGGEFVPLPGTETNKPITGNLIMDLPDVSTSRGIVVNRYLGANAQDNDLIQKKYAVDTFEAKLGNPTVDDYILSSKRNGQRSWIVPPTPVNGATDYVSDVKVQGNNLVFTKVGRAFNGNVPLPTWPMGEPTLGNPAVDGHVLSSLMNGTRSWVKRITHADLLPLLPKITINTGSVIDLDTSGENLCNYNVANQSLNYRIGKIIPNGKAIVLVNTPSEPKIPSLIIDSGAFEIGKAYIITSPNNTNFTLIGAANNNLGTRFIATGKGLGGGTAAEIINKRTSPFIPNSDMYMYVTNTGTLRGVEYYFESVGIININPIQPILRGFGAIRNTEFPNWPESTDSRPSFYTVHNGQGAIPQEGDIIYTDQAGLNTFDGLSAWWFSDFAINFNENEAVYSHRFRISINGLVTVVQTFQ